MIGRPLSVIGKRLYADGVTTAHPRPHRPPHANGFYRQTSGSSAGPLLVSAHADSMRLRLLHHWQLHGKQAITEVFAYACKLLWTFPTGIYGFFMCLLLSNRRADQTIWLPVYRCIQRILDSPDCFGTAFHRRVSFSQGLCIWHYDRLLRNE